MLIEPDEPIDPPPFEIGDTVKVNFCNSEYVHKITGCFKLRNEWRIQFENSRNHYPAICYDKID